MADPFDAACMELILAHENLTATKDMYPPEDKRVDAAYKRFAAAVNKLQLKEQPTDA